MKNNKENKGFTLVELVVTVAILLSISLVAVPSVLNMKNSQKNKQKERIKENIIMAKESYCNFNSCSSSIKLKTLINENLIDEESLEEFINIDNCTILTNNTLQNCEK